jgi:hypothetical protein
MGGRRTFRLNRSGPATAPARRHVQHSARRGVCRASSAPDGPSPIGSPEGLDGAVFAGCSFRRSVRGSSPARSRRVPHETAGSVPVRRVPHPRAEQAETPVWRSPRPARPRDGATRAGRHVSRGCDAAGLDGHLHRRERQHRRAVRREVTSQCLAPEESESVIACRATSHAPYRRSAGVLASIIGLAISAVARLCRTSWIRMATRPNEPLRRRRERRRPSGRPRDRTGLPGLRWCRTAFLHRAGRP